jgi:hypothetical protein
MDRTAEFQRVVDLFKNNTTSIDNCIEIKEYDSSFNDVVKRLTSLLDGNETLVNRIEKL